MNLDDPVIRVSSGVAGPGIWSASGDQDQNIRCAVGKRIRHRLIFTRAPMA